MGGNDPAMGAGDGTLQCLVRVQYVRGGLPGVDDKEERMRIAVTYDDPSSDVDVKFDLTKSDINQLIAHYDRKGWDHQTWMVVIDTDKQTWEHYQVEYDESLV